jgi:hypothetical protein
VRHKCGAARGPHPEAVPGQVGCAATQPAECARIGGAPSDPSDNAPMRWQARSRTRARGNRSSASHGVLTAAVSDAIAPLYAGAPQRRPDPACSRRRFCVRRAKSGSAGRPGCSTAGGLSGAAQGLCPRMAPRLSDDFANSSGNLTYGRGAGVERMDGSPASFPGGTFGSGGGVSIGVFTVAAALIGATAALCAVWARESYARFLDRKSLAAALLAEVELLLKAVVDDKETFERLDKWFRAAPSGESADHGLLTILEGHKGALNYRVSIFEKCAQQIGQLDAETAKSLVRFFYFVDGLRDEARPILFNPNAPLDVRREILCWMLRRNLPKGIREGLYLRDRLETEVARNWWSPRRSMTVCRLPFR